MAARIGRSWNVPGIGVAMLGEDTIFSCTVTIRDVDVSSLDRLCRQNVIAVKRDEYGKMVPVDSVSLHQNVSAKMRRKLRLPKGTQLRPAKLSYYLRGTSGAIRVVNDWAYGRAEIEWNTSSSVPNGMGLDRKGYSSSMKDGVVVTKEYRLPYRKPVAGPAKPPRDRSNELPLSVNKGFTPSHLVRSVGV